ncbi:MAG: heavy metal translocating P-type ATPase [Clostridia bacterium]|nr:heavy metal translocating P-type ATPase [Clostridia bacterium]
MKKIIQLRGLDCAGCAAELEEQIAAIEGVLSASIAFVNQKLTLVYETETALQAAIDTANHFEEVQVVERLETEQTSRVKAWWAIALSAFFFLAGLLFDFVFSGKIVTVLAYVSYAVAYLAVACPVLLATVKNLAKGRIFDENFLMTVASIGAVLLGEYFEGVAVMLLYRIGETLQAVAVRSSRNSITELMQLKSEFATLIEKRPCTCGHCHDLVETQRQVPPETLKIGDTVLVRTGEKIPVDGVLLTENATLDTSSLTGESLPRTVRGGEEILAGCINAGAVFTMRVIRLYEDSAVQKILDTVENAASKKAAPEKFITKFARYYTPVVCCLALCLGLIVPLVSGLIIDNRFYFMDFGRWATSALTFLVISCPCALIISVPLTYFSGIGACAKRGILVKGAAYLDIISKASTVAFDKTGTLTEGNFSVCSVRMENGVTEKELLSVVAAVEKNSSHPIAKAFSNVETDYIAQDVTETAGYGLTAMLNGERLLIGKAALLCDNGIECSDYDGAYTPVYVARGNTWLGLVEVGDKLRGSANETITALKELGVRRTVMLTGDEKERAAVIARQAAIDEVCAGLLPTDKLDKANDFKKDGVLVYVGDGINDAPVMTAADCSISMGKLGSAAAVESSDFVLISDDLKAIPECLRVARKTRKIVMQNIVGSIALKIAFMVLGAAGVLPLIFAVFADVGVMLLALANALRVKLIKRR